MSRALDLTGQPFGKLTVIQVTGRQNGKIMWECRCECGKTVNVVAGALRSGNTRSCGAVDCCTRTKHGHTARGKTSAAWRCWNNMIQRCFNPNSSWYHRYGGRGITVCEHWLGKHGFENFLTDMGEPPPGMTLDRFPDKDGNYEPTNCRWATPREQTINRSATKLSESLVQEIHGRYEHGEKVTSIASRMDVSSTLVSQILSDDKWKGSKNGPRY